MTKKQIINYKVIESSKKNKELFNEFLKYDCKVVGTFVNEYKELFVLYKWPKHIDNPLLTTTHPAKYIFITGDEFDWELGLVFFDETTIQSFYLSDDETKKANKLIKKYTKKGLKKEFEEKFNKMVGMEMGEAQKMWWSFISSHLK